jgi:hypothetical protein
MPSNWSTVAQIQGCANRSQHNALSDHWIFDGWSQFGVIRLPVTRPVVVKSHVQTIAYLCFGRNASFALSCYQTSHPKPSCSFPEIHISSLQNIFFKPVSQSVQGRLRVHFTAIIRSHILGINNQYSSGVSRATRHVRSKKSVPGDRGCSGTCWAVSKRDGASSGSAGRNDRGRARDACERGLRTPCRRLAGGAAEPASLGRTRAGVG